MIDLARPTRTARQERRRHAAAAGIENRRRIGRLTVPHTLVRAATSAATAV
jgi:hypothetical protein